MDFLLRVVIGVVFWRCCFPEMFYINSPPLSGLALVSQCGSSVPPGINTHESNRPISVWAGRRKRE
jgi:hypothetical protein